MLFRSMPALSLRGGDVMMVLSLVEAVIEAQVLTEGFRLDVRVSAFGAVIIALGHLDGFASTQKFSRSFFHFFGAVAAST